jgi:hypothetical protein
VWLSDGQLVVDGNAQNVISSYIESVSERRGEVTWALGDPKAGTERVQFRAARIVSGGQCTSEVKIDQPVALEYEFEVVGAARYVTTGVHMHDKLGTRVFSAAAPREYLEPGLYRHGFVLPGNLLNDGLYTFSLGVTTTDIHFRILDAITFTVHETGVGRDEYYGQFEGCIRPMLQWSTERIV